MLLVIDVGNTNFVLGLYKKEKLVKCWRMTTGGNRTADETGIFIHGLFDAAGIDAGKVEAVIISSVVPDIMYSLTQGIRKYFNIEPMIVGVGMKTGIVIKRDDPKSVGSDRIVDLVAANEIYGGPAIVIDYGTANTFDVINEKSEFITGFITPGISSCAEALYQKAAQLPKIEIKAPKTIIAKNTVNSFQAGLVLGHIGQTKYIIEQLKEKLYREGLFDSEHKKPLPKFPNRIAVVTSAAGAAVHDMIRILRRRYPLAKVILLPVRVQGAEAPAEIAGAIRYADQWKIGDVIITGRGGGSMEDLWAFNDERVARAIYACETPVISAVGHEPDVTISDFVADARASTPSNAAEIAVPDQGALLRQVGDLENRLTGSETVRLRSLRERLEELKRKRVLTDHLAYVQDRRMELAHLQQRLGDLTGAAIGRKRQAFTAAAASLDAMSPLKVLSRGYAVARNEAGEVLRSSAELSRGEYVHVTLGSGGFTAVVNTIEEEDDGCKKNEL